MKESTVATNFEPKECVIFVQSMKIGTHENKAGSTEAIWTKCLAQGHMLELGTLGLQGQCSNHCATAPLWTTEWWLPKEIEGTERMLPYLIKTVH